jgi:hypothetical protein
MDGGRQGLLCDGKESRRGFHGAGRTDEVTDLAFRRARRRRRFSEDLVNGPGFGRVVLARTGPVRVDVVDVARSNRRVGERRAHRCDGAALVLVGIRDPEGIHGRSVPQDLCEHRGSAGLGRRQALDEERGGAFAQHEAIPTCIEGPRGCGTQVIALRQRTEEREAAHAQGIHHGIETAAQDGIELAIAHGPEGLFTSFATLEHELDLEDRASAILVYGHDAQLAEPLATTIGLAFPDTIARAWQNVAGFVGQAIRGNRKLAAVSLWMGTLSVAIPVLALLFVHVIAERRQIAIVRALGLRVGEVFAVYLLKAALVATVGVVIGVGVGIALYAHFQRAPIFQNDGFVIRPVLHLSSVAMPCLIVVAAALLAGVIPAIRAARTNPAELLQLG